RGESPRPPLPHQPSAAVTPRPPGSAPPQRPRGLVESLFSLSPRSRAGSSLGSYGSRLRVGPPALARARLVRSIRPLQGGNLLVASSVALQGSGRRLEDRKSVV